MSAHTPGPWVVSANVIAVPGGRALAQLPLAPTIELAEENSANARLIAAAPEMLEALREILEFARDGVRPDALAFQRAHAAIAKAGGK